MEGSPELGSPRFPEWRVLLGFMGESAGLNFINSQGIKLESKVQEVLQTRIKEAVAYVKQLPDRSKVRPEAKDLPPEARERIAKLEGEPSVKFNNQGSTANESALN